MQVEKLKNVKIYQTASFYSKLFNKAIQKAQTEIHKKGLPHVFTKNGKIYYELPNGEITTKEPAELK